MVNHDWLWLGTAVQKQNGLLALRAKNADPPSEVAFADALARPNWQLPPACVTITVWPAMVIVPWRCTPVLASTTNPTWANPEPPPLAGEVMVIHGTLETAVHVSQLRSRL